MRIGREHSAPGTSNHLIYLIKLTVGHRYPDENFGGNQLLDGLISLLPLYLNVSIDFHVRINTGFYHIFPWIHHIQAYLTIFWVPTCMLTLRPFSQSIMAGGRFALGITPLSLTFRIGVFHPFTHIYVRLLGPYFKTGLRKPFSQHHECIATLHTPSEDRSNGLEHP